MNVAKQDHVGFSSIKNEYSFENIHDTNTILDSKTRDGRAEAVCGSCSSDRAGAAADGGCDHRAGPDDSSGGRHGDKGQGPVAAQAGSASSEQSYHKAASGSLRRFGHGREGV